MNYNELVRGPLEGDIKFKNVVMAILNFAIDKLSDFKGKSKEKYIKDYYDIRNGIEYQFQHPVARDRLTVLLDLESMIVLLPPPKVKKVVREYYDTQMTAYCHSMRGFSKEIPYYPYKSDNIVDLLEEVDKVNEEKKNAFSAEFSPKPFCFSCYNNREFSNSIYKPRKDVLVDGSGNRRCSCVHMCKKFLTYPVLAQGIRLVPDGAKCDYDGFSKCRASRVFKNGICSEESQSIEHVPGLIKLTNKQR